MNIYASKSKGIVFRRGTVMSAMYEVLNEMNPGDKINIESVFDIFDSPISFSSIRMAINKISERNGIKYATKKNGVSLMVLRVD